MKERVKRMIRRFDFAVSDALSRNFLPIQPDQIEHLRNFFLITWLREAESAGSPRADVIKSYWLSDTGTAEIEDHIIGRVERDRVEYIPWLNSLLRLKGARILEIGCGSGSSIMALAEQDAQVTGIDVVPAAVEMTRERLRVFGLAAKALLNINATEIGSLFKRGDFDLIIFFASLEHMTLGERLESLRAAWGLLEPGALLCVVQAPNRLWYFDDHTSNLSFFHWLPDKLALAYWRRSPNYDCDPVYDTLSADSLEALARLGRGVSFHEFEIALAPFQRLTFLTDRFSFLIRQNPLRMLHYAVSRKRRYARFLRKREPSVPFAFFLPYLDVVMRR